LILLVKFDIMMKEQYHSRKESWSTKLIAVGHGVIIRKKIMPVFAIDRTKSGFSASYRMIKKLKKDYEIIVAKWSKLMYDFTGLKRQA